MLNCHLWIITNTHFGTDFNWNSSTDNFIFYTSTSKIWKQTRKKNKQTKMTKQQQQKKLLVNIRFFLLWISSWFFQSFLDCHLKYTALPYRRYSELWFGPTSDSSLGRIISKAFHSSNIVHQDPFGLDTADLWHFGFSLLITKLDKKMKYISWNSSIYFMLKSSWI